MLGDLDSLRLLHFHTLRAGLSWSSALIFCRHAASWTECVSAFMSSFSRRQQRSRWCS